MSIGEQQTDPGQEASTRPLARTPDPQFDWLSPSSPSARRPGSGAGAYWTGLVALLVGLGAVVVALATQVTSVVQTVLVAIPLFLVGFGMERVGKSVRRGSLRGAGITLSLLAVVAPIVLSLSSPRTVTTVTTSAAPPGGSTQAVLRATLGGGQLRLGPGASGLYDAQLRSPGASSAGVTSNGNTAVVDLRAPAQHGLLARNRGSEWEAKLSTGLPWQVEVDGGALTADLQLRDLDVRSVRLQADISRLALRLGQPAAQVPVDLQISAGLVDLYVPRAAGFDVAVDGVMLNNFADAGLRKTNTGWSTVERGARGRYVIRIRGATGRVRVHRI